jgi:hypothetical protein
MGRASPEKHDGRHLEDADRTDEPARDDETAPEDGEQLERDVAIEPSRPGAVKYVPL